MTASLSDEAKPADSQPAVPQAKTRRAEEIVEDVGGRIVAVVSTAVARAREEAEDIWADAKSARRGPRS